MISLKIKKSGFFVGLMAFMAGMLLPAFGPPGAAEASWFQGAEFDHNAVKREFNKMKKLPGTINWDIPHLEEIARRLQSKIVSLKTALQKKQQQLEHLKTSHAAVRTRQRQEAVSKAKGKVRSFWNKVKEVPKEYDSWDEYHEDREWRQIQNSGR